jgi:hypothetical protein
MHLPLRYIVNPALSINDLELAVFASPLARNVRFVRYDLLPLPTRAHCTLSGRNRILFKVELAVGSGRRNLHVFWQKKHHSINRPPRARDVSFFASRPWYYQGVNRVFRTSFGLWTQFRQRAQSRRPDLGAI